MWIGYPRLTNYKREKDLTRLTCSEAIGARAGRADTIINSPLVNSDRARTIAGGM